MSPGFVVHVTRSNSVGHVFLEIRTSNATRFVELTTASGHFFLGYAASARQGRESVYGQDDGRINIYDSMPYGNQTIISSPFILASDSEAYNAFNHAVSRFNSKDGITDYDLFDNSCITFVSELLKIGGFHGDIGALFTREQADRLELNTWLSHHRLMKGLPRVQAVGSMFDGFLQENGLPRCFLAGTPIMMADGSTKPIEAIRPGDEVAAFDPQAQQGLGPLQPGKVTRIFTNVTRTIVNLRGLHMTPGHVVLMDNGEWDIIARALKDDRAIVEQREAHAVPVRARTGAVLGSAQDIPITIAYADPATGCERFALVRAGIPVAVREGTDGNVDLYSMADVLHAQGYVIEPDGTILDKKGVRYDATPWAGEDIPDALPMQQNWIVELDGEAYTPPWILDLPQEHEDDGQMVVNVGPSGVSAHRPGLRLLN